MIKKIYLRIACLVLLLMTSCKEDSSGNKLGEKHEFTNALIEETSPYLLQHAHNPVDWRAWSPEALEDAKKENKLVLVSIGYSSCHWCHVMEDETFENEEVAELMNKNFINIKVDREERPDVDQVYQDFQRLTGGNTGWPLNVIVLPNGKPLYGGTYHTKDQWIQVLGKIDNMYRNDPDKAAEYSDMVTAGIAEVNLVQPVDGYESLTKDALKSSVENWKQHWDAEWGGDKVIEKFMIPSNLDFLLDYSELTGDVTAKAHVENTLDKILSGGVYDHVGGGFFRYSTDAKWKVPHFEKMLYDNAQAIGLYSKAFKIFKKPEYRDAVMETISFLEREMKNAEGGYYSALDSQSEGEEGKFYVWKEEELKSLLQDDFELFASYYNIAPEAIWEEGNYVLHKSVDDQSFSQKHSISMSELRSSKALWREKLLKAREMKVRPGSDDKILTSWNALLIQGLVTSYEAFGLKEHLDRAEAISEFLRKNSYVKQLIHSYKKGSQRKEGFLEDYAFLMEASLSLYGVTMNMEYLDLAQELNLKATEKFSDKASGMFRYNEGEELISKIIKTNDGELPSPNAIMAHNLFRLGHLIYEPEMMDRSKKMLSSMVPALTESAPSYSKWNALLLNTTYPYYEIAVVGNDAGVLMPELNDKHLPNTIVVGSMTNSELPLFKGRHSDENTLIYVCQNTTCKLPVETVKEALHQLANF
ncbi:MAG: thioredoxin domain-containing protein [Aurantibacter sp.]